MEQYSRLFDCLSIEQIIQKPALLSAKVNGSYKDLSTKSIIDTTNALTNGLIQLGIRVKEGIENQDKIGLISNSRPLRTANEARTRRAVYQSKLCVACGPWNPMTIPVFTAAMGGAPTRQKSHKRHAFLSSSVRPCFSLQTMAAITNTIAKARISVSVATQSGTVHPKAEQMPVSASLASMPT